MKAKLLYLILFLAVVKGWSQTSAVSRSVDAPFLGRESIAMHLNSTFFVTGETMLFNIYCTEQSSSKLSVKSSIAYVELIAHNARPVVQMKVNMKGGTGAGDLTIGDDVASGNYTLIAYTKWMRNFDVRHFFRVNITIINPGVKPASSSAAPAAAVVPARSESISSQGLVVKTDKNEYNRRDKVTVELQVDPNTTITLSASVRMFEENEVIPSPWMDTTMHELSVSSKPQFLPDLRGELISGRILDKSNKKPLAGAIITLASPSKAFKFFTSTTDSEGRYFFNAKGIGSDFMLLGIQNRKLDDFVIETDNPFFGNYAAFIPPKLVVDNALMKVASRRLTSAQIENAFYAVKKDSFLTTGPDSARFFSKADKIYDLNKFTRFPTMDDVFREIIQEVIVKVREGNYSLLMVNGVTGFRFTNPPLVLIDGVPVADANLLMKYDPSFIRTISLVLRRYYYGGLEAEGILSIETFDGDAKNLPVTDMVSVKYLRPTISSVPYKPDYNATKDLSRVPDFRTQLYWNPCVDLETGAKTITFYTGDIPGEYVIELVGIASTGQRVYLQQKFLVK